MIRAYRDTDREQLLWLHQKHSGGELYLPDPDSVYHFETIVAEEDGKIVAAVSGEVSIEGFLMLDPEHGTAEERWLLAKKLIDAGALATRHSGWRRLHLHTQLHRFAERLAKLPGVHDTAEHHLVLALEG